MAGSRSLIVPQLLKASNGRRSKMCYPQDISRAALICATFAVCCLLLCYYRFSTFPVASLLDENPTSSERKLERALRAAAMADKTVIITTLNEAWAASGSIFDLFLESFRTGEKTSRLLNHLLVLALDNQAYRRCLQVHTQCLALHTEGSNFNQETFFNTPGYLEIVWRRIDFLRLVLQMGYNFVFSDADVMWLRDPFRHFDPYADIHMACDHFWGSSVNSSSVINSGFMFVRANNRSIEFYEYWYASRERYPGLHDQGVLNVIRFKAVTLGLKVHLLDTAYFGGLCEPSKNLNLVCTMHATCCFGMNAKIHELKAMLKDWRYFISFAPRWRRSHAFKWSVPQKCGMAAFADHRNSNATKLKDHNMK